MISCSICQTSNHHLETICTQCHAFLQTRIDNLDLFGTAWKLFERPMSAFRTIAIAEHKNYGIILSALAGVSMAFVSLWALKAGEYDHTLISVISLGVTVGPVAGILVVLFLALCLKFFSQCIGRFSSFRNAFAVMAYSTIPLVIALLFVFPIELLTFGNFFFMSNPSPYLLKPLSYVTLLSLHAGFALWSSLLALIGVKMLLDTSWSRAMLVMLLSLSMLAGLITLAFIVFSPEVAADGSSRV